MRPILQTQAAECSLACLCMVGNHHGLLLDLPELRKRFSVSLKGSNLQQMVQQAAALGLESRPLQAELHEITELKTPAILHWGLNHVVVLKKASKRFVTIVDPAVGLRKLTWAEASKHYTGVALELVRGANFAPGKVLPKVSLAALTGHVVGLKRSLAQIFCVALVLQLFAIVAPLFNQLVVDEVLTSGDQDLLVVLSLGFALLMVTQTAVGLARSWLVMVLGQSLSLQWAGNVFAHLIRLPTRFFEARHLGDITSRFGAVGAIQRTLTTGAVEALLDGIMCLAALGMMLLYSPQLAAVVALAVAAYGLVRWASYGPLRNAQAERLVVAAKENSHFLETLRAIGPLKLFGREEERRARWQNLLVNVQNRDVQTAKMNIGFGVANTAIFGLQGILVFYLGAKLVMSGVNQPSPFTVGMLFAFTSYSGQFTSRVAGLIGFLVELKMLDLHRERLADIALEPPERDTPDGNLPPSDLAHLPASLELRNVSFRYGDGEHWVLKNANLRIEAGDSVAIVGPSGGGKTTLLKIMLGLLAPIEGEVFYGGFPIRQLGLANVRGCIGTVMQEDVLLTGSIADNISFFDLAPDMQRVQNCAALAQVAADIARMPMGFQTLVGDLGSGLSGGQKQRVLLARALYKQPKVLALDEATSHLDVANERLVTQTLQRLQLTRVVIAHRPETIAGATRVVQVQRADGQGAQVSEVLRGVASPESPPGLPAQPAVSSVSALPA